MKPINLVVESGSSERFQKAIFDALASFILIIAASGFTALAYNGLYMIGRGVIMLCAVTVMGFLAAWLCYSWWKKQYMDLMIIRPFRRDVATFMIPFIGLLVGTLPFYGYMTAERAVSPLLLALYPLTSLFFCCGAVLFALVRLVIRILRAR